MNFTNPERDFYERIHNHSTGRERMAYIRELNAAVNAEANRRNLARNEIMRDYRRYVPLVNNQPTSVEGETPLQTMMANAEEQADTDEEESGGDYIEVDTANRLRERATQRIIDIHNYQRNIARLAQYNRHMFLNLDSPSVPAVIAPPPLPPPN
jgi:ribonuclease D